MLPPRGARSAWEAGEALQSPASSPPPPHAPALPGGADGASVELPTLTTLRQARMRVLVCVSRRALTLTRARRRQALDASDCRVNVDAMLTRCEEDCTLGIAWSPRDGQASARRAQLRGIARTHLPQSLRQHAHPSAQRLDGAALAEQLAAPGAVVQVAASGVAHAGLQRALLLVDRALECAAQRLAAAKQAASPATTPAESQ